MGTVGSRMEFNSVLWLVMLTKLLGFLNCYFGKKMAGNPSGPVTVMCSFLPVHWAVCTHCDVLLCFHQSGGLRYEHIRDSFFFPSKRIKKQYILTGKCFLCSSDTANSEAKCLLQLFCPFLPTLP